MMLAVLKRLLVAGAVLVPLAMPAAAMAATDPFQNACQGQTGGNAGQSAVCSDGGNGENPISGPNGVIVKVTTILAAICGMISVIFIIIGGMKYITSNGDSSSVSTAKQTIIYALVGVLVALLARPIISIVISRL